MKSYPAARLKIAMSRLALVVFALSTLAMCAMAAEPMADGVGWRICGYNFNARNSYWNWNRAGSVQTTIYNTRDGWSKFMGGLDSQPRFCVYYDSVDFSHGQFPPELYNTVGHSKFVVQGTGVFSAPAAGTYEWKLCGDDGVLLIIDGEVISSKSWRQQGRRCYTESTHLEAGSHQIETVMYEWHGKEVWQLYGGPGNDLNTPMKIMSAPVQGVCYDGNKYFTLGEAHGMTTATDCQSDAMTVPEWATLAPNDQTSQSVVTGSYFGTECAVLADGSAIKTASALPTGASSQPVELDDEHTTIKKTTTSSHLASVPLADTHTTVELVSANFAGVTGHSTFVYRVTVGSAGSTVNHWTLGIGAGCTIIRESTDFNILSYGIDPASGLPGVRAAKSAAPGSSYDITLTLWLDQTSTSSIPFSVATDSTSAIGSVAGPLCGSAAPSVITTNSMSASADCGSNMLMGDASGYSASCSDGTARRVLAVKTGCDPGDIDMASPVISNFVTFGGMRYATLDNADPNAVNRDGCHGSISTIPNGWSIAEYNDDSAMVNYMGGSNAKFGTGCLIYADGVGRSNKFGEFNGVCASNAIEVLPVPEGSLLRVFNHWCPARILISQPAPAGESDSFSFEHTSAFPATRAVAGFHYASLDGAPVAGSDVGCQTQPFTIPDGWEIVPEPTTQLNSVQRFHSFQTECLVTATGEGVTAFGSCGNGMLFSHTAGGKTFYMVNSCNARVVIRKAEVIDHSSLFEPCGVCTGWGDPHMTTFDGTRYDSYGEESIVRAVTVNPMYDTCADYDQPSWMCNFNIWAWQVPLRHVATNKAVLVRHVRADGYAEGIQVILEDHTNPDRSVPPVLKINNVLTPLDFGDDEITTLAGAVISRVKGRRNRNAWRIVLPNSVVVEVTHGYWRQHLLDYVITLPKLFAGANTVYGLCSDCDGTHKNDYYCPHTGEFLSKDDLKGNRRQRRSQIQNFFVNCNVETGPNPFDEEYQCPPAVELPEEAPSVCDNAEQRVLDLIDTCCAGRTDEEYDLCRDEVCINEGCDSMDTLDDMNDEKDKIINDPAEVTCTIAPMQGFAASPATHGGRVYAVLDGVIPEEIDLGNMAVGEYYQVPSGWRIARADELNYAMASCYRFGVDCLVLADGTGVSTDGTSANCGHNLLARAGQSSECVKASGPNMRVLLTKELDSNLASSLNSGCFTSDCGWYAQNADDVLEYIMEADPSGRPVVKVTNNDIQTVRGVHRTWQVSGLDRFTAPFSASVWTQTDGEIIIMGPEWKYVQLDVFLADGTKMTSRHHHTSIAAGGRQTHGWEQTVVDINLPKIYSENSRGADSTPVIRIALHLAAKSIWGTVMFGQPYFDVALPAQFNLVPNGNFDERLIHSSQNAFEGWLATYGSPVIQRTSSVSGLGSHPSGGSGFLELTGWGEQQATVMASFAAPDGGDGLYHAASPDAILFCMWHKVENIFGGESAKSSLYVDFIGDCESTNECMSYGNVIPTMTGTTGWYRRCHSFDTRGQATTRMAVTARLANGHDLAKSMFDGISALRSCPAANTKPLTSCTFGDPHYMTLDGAQYDAQHIGEYRLYEDDIMRIQHRHSQAGGAAVVSAVAVQHVGSGVVVQVTRPDVNELEPQILVNGEAVSILNKYTVSDESSKVTIHRDGALSDPSDNARSTLRFYIVMTGIEQDYDSNGDTYDVTVQAKVEVTVQNTVYGTSFLAVAISDPSTVGYNVATGLLGNKNGDKSDDFVTPAGEVIADALTNPAELERFVESWRVTTTEQSIFTYPRGENVDTYYDPTFIPSASGSFTDEQRDAARQTCIDAGVPPAYLESCIFDVLSAGDGFAIAAAGMSSSISMADAPLFDDSTSTTGSAIGDEATSSSAVLFAALTSAMAVLVFISLICLSVTVCLGFVLRRAVRSQQQQKAARMDSALPTHLPDGKRVESFDVQTTIQNQLATAVRHVANLLDNTPAMSPSPSKQYASIRDNSGSDNDFDIEFANEPNRHRSITTNAELDRMVSNADESDLPSRSRLSTNPY